MGSNQQHWYLIPPADLMCPIDDAEELSILDVANIEQNLVKREMAAGGAMSGGAMSNIDDDVEELGNLDAINIEQNQVKREMGAGGAVSGGATSNIDATNAVSTSGGNLLHTAPPVEHISVLYSDEPAEPEEKPMIRHDCMWAGTCSDYVHASLACSKAIVNIVKQEDPELLQQQDQPLGQEHCNKKPPHQHNQSNHQATSTSTAKSAGGSHCSNTSKDAASDGCATGARSVSLPGNATLPSGPTKLPMVFKATQSSSQIPPGGSLLIKRERQPQQHFATPTKYLNQSSPTPSSELPSGSSNVGDGEQQRHILRVPSIPPGSFIAMREQEARNINAQNHVRPDTPLSIDEDSGVFEYRNGSSFARLNNLGGNCSHPTAKGCFKVTQNTEAATRITELRELFLNFDCLEQGNTHDSSCNRLTQWMHNFQEMEERDWHCGGYNLSQASVFGNCPSVPKLVQFNGSSAGRGWISDDDEVDVDIEDLWNQPELVYNNDHTALSSDEDEDEECDNDDYKDHLEEKYDYDTDNEEESGDDCEEAKKDSCEEVSLHTSGSGIRGQQQWSQRRAGLYKTDHRHEMASGEMPGCSYKATHVGDHSYTRAGRGYNMNELGVQTPFDSDEDIDVVSIFDKNLPTNPTARDYHNLQSHVAKRIRTAPSRSRACDQQQLGGGDQPLDGIFPTPVGSTMMSGVSTPLPPEGGYQAAFASSSGTTRKRPTSNKRSRTRTNKRSRGSLADCSNFMLDSSLVGGAALQDPIAALDTIKREMHNGLERQRRIGLIKLFHELKDQLPSLSHMDRASKVVILREATILCQQLTQQDRELNELLQQQVQLYERVRSLRKDLHKERSDGKD